MHRPARRQAYSSVRIRNQNRIPILFLGTAALIAVAGCSTADEGANGGGTTAPSSPAPSKTVSPEEAKARKAVVAAYQGMNDEQVQAYAAGSLKGSRITQFATGNALRDTKDTIFVDMQNDIVFKGKPKLTIDPNDVEVDLKADPKRATLRVCFDMNTWEPVNKKTGKSVAPPDQAKRYTLNAKLLSRGGLWLVSDDVADKERKC
ncbi:hypothetical protein OHO83_09110 [Streptomyces sp. NBC_00569]|uniref:hypothetical protein n=1 Tax=Streptomyces sp. NBC_00569 TaxID=2975780 RepID=UPI002E81229E|nr:hypothetical protein [Streptomyces sp. NBC_00569]WUB92458.1 hypothetical protein OHO83_09110 [Streptomyces sp. NBC_00569]